MGFTLLRIGDSRLLVSNEYAVEKDRDAEGKVLPEQEWRHPDPLTLRYTDFGQVHGSDHFKSMFGTIMHLGVKCFGGHVRLISEDAESILRGRQQSWADKTAEDKAWQEELEAEELEKREQKRLPRYQWCGRCEKQTEVCKSDEHRGNRCMTCCGGVGDRCKRHCLNCLDLPYRLKREEALAVPIVYVGEEDR